jgi:glycosyltransferase involved in cell wall biosynthesis
MHWSRRCSAVVPCLNEERTVGALVQQLRALALTVLVVDDGSADGTSAAARRAGARTLRHDGNRGKGAALQTGLAEARRLGFSWALTLDGDGQHRPDDVPRFWACAQATEASLIVGNRFHRSEAIPWARRWTNRWMSARLSRVVGQRLPDSQCGFRLVRLEAWERLRLAAPRFEVESEMLLAFARAGFGIGFVAIQVVAASRPSRIRPVRDGFRWLRWWSRVSRVQHAALSMPALVGGATAPAASVGSTRSSVLGSRPDPLASGGGV